MESVKVMYLPAEIITADHHALNHSADKTVDEENTAIIRKLVIAGQNESSTEDFYYNELHFANYE